MKMQILEQLDKQTEIMKKYGPHDTAYASLFLAEDLQLVQKFFSKIDTQINPPQIIEYFNKCEQKWNDHNPILKVGNKQVQFLQVAKADDIVTIQGLCFCARMIITSGLAPWRYHGVGSGTREARCYQPTLHSELEPRADMTIAAQGSISRVNQSMRFVGIFPASFPSLTVNESGVWNNVSGTSGTLLNRQQFVSGSIAHTAGGTAFTVATDINFVPVTTWG
jgi:hypothetical protein